MSETTASPTDRVAGGPFLRSLDLTAAATEEDSRGPSPGMLTSAERALLSEIVRRAWRGAGVIVDGGSFLGSSLVAEAQGLRAIESVDGSALARLPAGKPIHGFERGHHPEPANPGADRRRSYAGIEFVLGESFVPMLEANIAPYRDLIELHIGDLTQMRWDGSPVELAFIDVCKTSELNAHVSRQFYPALIGGASMLIHQDFFFDQLPWIRVTMGYLADYFRWEGQVASSSVYTCTRAIPEAVAAYDPFTEATLDECLAYHDATAFPGVDRTAQLMLALSRVVLILAKGDPGQALDRLEDTAVEYADLIGPMTQASSYRPLTGSPDAMLPRYRMDRVVGKVLGAMSSGRPRGDDRGPRGSAEQPSDLDLARDALAHRDWDQARRILEPLVPDDPRGNATLLLARTEFEAGQVDVAAAQLDALLARRPRHTRALALRARTHLVAGDHASARTQADEALRIDPDLVMARRVLFDLAVAQRLHAGSSR